MMLTRTLVPSLLVANSRTTFTSLRSTGRVEVLDGHAQELAARRVLQRDDEQVVVTAERGLNQLVLERAELPPFALRFAQIERELTAVAVLHRRQDSPGRVVGLQLNLGDAR